jgi:hypothetical protein
MVWCSVEDYPVLRNFKRGVDPVLEFGFECFKPVPDPFFIGIEQKFTAPDRAEV